MESDPLLKLAHTRSTPHGARRIDELGERILAEARALFRFDEFFFALVDREQGALDVRVHELRGIRQPAKSTRLSVGLFGQVAERAEGLLIKDWKTRPRGLCSGAPWSRTRRRAR